MDLLSATTTYRPINTQAIHYYGHVHFEARGDITA